ncbi:MAG: nitrilase-related carbon-nitrogen hydrolase [Candidatus Heimdallarchaeota archaeon]
MKVGYVQISPIFGEKENNFKQVADLLEQVKASLIVLPELFATGYTFISKKEAYELGEDRNGKTVDFLKKLSKKTGAIIIGGFIENFEDKIYNSAIMVSGADIIGIYRKLHLYYKEKLWFSPGNLPLRIYEVKGVRIGMMICFDWFFPETMRTLSLLGADIIAHPANLVLPYCQKAMVIRCLENRVYAITSNRIGQEMRGTDDFIFTGASQITSFDGEILSTAPHDTTSVDFVEIDLKNSRNKKINIYNDLFEDRRTSFYHLGL